MKLGKWYYNIRTRLILVITLIIVFIAMSISYVIYNYSNFFLKEKMASLMTDSLTKYTSSLGNMLLGVYHVALNAASDPEIIQAVEAFETSFDVEQKDALYQKLKEKCQLDSSIQSIYVYIPDSNLIITSNSLRKSRYVSDELKYPWISNHTKATNLLSLTEYWDETGVFKNFFYSVVKPLKDDDNHTIGLISVNVDANMVYRNFLSDIVKDDGASIMLINKSNEVVYHMLKSMYLTKIEQSGPYQNISNYAKGYYTANINGVETLIVFVPEEYSEYKMVYTVPLSGITYGINNVRLLAVALSLISILFGAVMILFFSKSIYSPILSIKSAMLRFGQGDFQIRIQEERKDEFQVLYEGFNHMTEEVGRLVNETIAQKVKLKEEHFRALQSQISPHFIYNTLNSIKCAAILQKDFIASEMLEAFIELLQISADHKRTMIPLSEEIRQVTNYVLLQKHRYGDLFDVHYLVDDDVKDFMVPKLILQPLVENSLNHGINLRDGNGSIQIKAYRVEDGMIIEVSDNGKEANLQTIRRILKTKGKSRFSGIGIPNIHERILLTYGPPYGLNYEKMEDGSLNAILHIGNVSHKN